MPKDRGRNLAMVHSKADSPSHLIWRLANQIASKGVNQAELFCRDGKTLSQTNCFFQEKWLVIFFGCCLTKNRFSYNMSYNIQEGSIMSCKEVFIQVDRKDGL